MCFVLKFSLVSVVAKAKEDRHSQKNGGASERLVNPGVLLKVRLLGNSTVSLMFPAMNLPAIGGCPFSRLSTGGLRTSSEACLEDLSHLGNSYDSWADPVESVVPAQATRISEVSTCGSPLWLTQGIFPPHSWDLTPGKMGLMYRNRRCL